MGGPAMIEGGGLGRLKPEDIGPVDVQSVVDIVVEDEAEAVAATKTYLSYFQGPVARRGNALTSVSCAGSFRRIVVAVTTFARRSPCWPTKVPCSSCAVVAWPTGEFGGMGIEGAVRLGYRRELEAISDPEEQQQFFESKAGHLYDVGKAVNMAASMEIDAVIDPAETRSWIMHGLNAVPAGGLD